MRSDELISSAERTVFSAVCARNWRMRSGRCDLHAMVAVEVVVVVVVVDGRLSSWELGRVSMRSTHWLAGICAAIDVVVVVVV